MAEDGVIYDLPNQTEFLATGVLPTTATQNRPSRGEDCSICLEPLDTAPSNGVIKIVECDHFFHTTCLCDWFSRITDRYGTCPNCREPLFHAPGQLSDIMDAVRAFIADDLNQDPLIPLSDEDQEREQFNIDATRLLDESYELVPGLTHLLESRMMLGEHFHDLLLRRPEALALDSERTSFNEAVRNLREDRRQFQLNCIAFRNRLDALNDRLTPLRARRDRRLTEDTPQHFDDPPVPGYDTDLLPSWFPRRDFVMNRGVTSNEGRVSGYVIERIPSWVPRSDFIRWASDRNHDRTRSYVAMIEWFVEDTRRLFENEMPHVDLELPVPATPSV
ncbi:hypothetical protein P280DRAFT_477404 [Massarina eburnea CBS 473.64]|uniref:RING-type domain-containing protein n=1 Tax=Massarina eburnea CBS 473.64 TaxID=1395130 RepID=A0A6A6S897_9PLEO|nr:hypothetical protein P280DRAFT_477404 [Massarina eburnea CBS 473.64]